MNGFDDRSLESPRRASSASFRPSRPYGARNQALWRQRLASRRRRDSIERHASRDDAVIARVDARGPRRFRRRVVSGGRFARWNDEPTAACALAAAPAPRRGRRRRLELVVGVCCIASGADCTPYVDGSIETRLAWDVLRETLDDEDEEERPVLDDARDALLLASWRTSTSIIFSSNLPCDPPCASTIDSSVRNPTKK